MTQSRTPQPSKYWLDQVADDIIKRFPKGEIVVSSGHSPSGPYHIGTIRELMTANAITWALQQRKRQAKHLDFVDDLDVLRKLVPELPPDLINQLGKPLHFAASPDENVTYADYFLNDLIDAEHQVGFVPDQTLRASNTYLKEKRYTDAISNALSKLPRVREIIEEVSHRKLAIDWAPVQLISDNDRYDEWFYTGHDTTNKTVSYRTKTGATGEVSYAEGRVKLDWRLDWPARWWMWDVKVEPFGRDHATKGGSYDTGKVLVEEIFGGEAPYPVPYEFIIGSGETKKMSKSAGGVITPKDALQIMPAEALRYFVVRSRPAKQLVFDSGMGLYNLLNEFALVQACDKPEFKEAYDYATSGSTDLVIASVPFDHLVSVYQTAQGDLSGILELIKRTGWAPADAAEQKVLESELGFAKNWLEKYAPDDVKFSVQKNLPTFDISSSQAAFLDYLASAIEKHDGDIDGQTMHELIYAAKELASIPPAEAFRSLYRLILGQDSGPKAGWFLASLDRIWLIDRLKRQK
jgi:lysyl-tRNA synthetase, class I